jgi:hypothetical protein
MRHAFEKYSLVRPRHKVARLYGIGVRKKATKTPHSKALAHQMESSDEEAIVQIQRVEACSECNFVSLIDIARLPC